MHQAVALSFNWRTKEVMFEDFEGDRAGWKADNWVAPHSLIWRDYPAEAGWTHVSVKNHACSAATLVGVVELGEENFCAFVEEGAQVYGRALEPAP